VAKQGDGWRSRGMVGLIGGAVWLSWKGMGGQICRGMGGSVVGSWVATSKLEEVDG
jgi:hypothetical protein